MDEGNLFAGLPAGPLADERFDTLLTRPGLRIERIVSTGQASPPGFWYEQDDAEWVVLLTGDAAVRFADEAVARELRPGDWLCIPQRRRHRVERTSTEPPAVWLALHFAEDEVSAVPAPSHQD